MIKIYLNGVYSKTGSIYAYFLLGMVTGSMIFQFIAAIVRLLASFS